MRKSLTILGAALMIVALVAVSVIGAAPAGTVAASSAPLAPAVVGSASQPAAVETPAAPAGPAAAPDKLTAGQHPGVYYLDYGGTVVDPKQYPVDGSMRMFQWSALQSGTNVYNWALLDNWIVERLTLGLSTGVFISTYDGKKDGDIRSTPDFVIQKSGAMITMPETYTTGLGGTGSARSGFSDYLQPQNGDFESSWHPTGWDLSGDAQVVNVSSIGGSWAGRLGGADNSQGSITRFATRIPAMPPEATTGVRMELQFTTNVQTTDLTPNADHLYVELLDANNNLLESLADITNSSGTNNTWVVNAPINLNNWMARTLKIRFRSTTDGATPTTFYVDDVQWRVRLVIPRYWSTPYKDAYSAFVTALGAHLRNDSRVDFVAIGTGLHGETQPANEDEKNYLWEFENLRSNADATHPGWVETANGITDMYANAFAQGTSLRKNLLLQYAPFFKNASERKSMTDFAVGRSVGLSLNGLLPDWGGGAFVTGASAGTGSYDPMVSSGRYNFVPIAWESYTYMLCTPVFTYWSLFSALDKHADYLRIDDDLLQGTQGAENTVFFKWAKDYWGKTLQTTKSVWTVMREHRNPTPYCHARTYPTYAYRGADGNTYQWPASKGSTWPQLGNYNFWLYQDDAITGGRTVPETNDKGADSRYAVDPVTHTPWTYAGLGNCPTSNSYASFYPANYACNNTPYNPDLPALGSDASNYYAPDNWVGSGKEAWVVRRTDQATGNPYMWFLIDDQYIDGSQTYSVTISVKYFDIGTDTWSLRYDSASGVSGGKLAGTITKTNSKQVKQATFNISDGKFAQRLASNQADFVIDSNNDGNEWIHMVDLAKKASFDPPTPEPTTTNTPTVTPTPSATPTATPTTGVVEGYAFWDKNGNGLKDPDDPGTEGAVIILRQGGVELYSATSGPDGKYRFGAVTPGQYFLSEKTPPPGYLANMMTVLVAVGANQTFDQIHFGHQQGPTSTPTSTPLPGAKKIFLPLVLRDFFTP